MAALDKVDLSGVASSTNVLVIRALIAHEFWIWFEEHKEDKVIGLKKILFFSVTVKVKHIKPVFVLLFGPKIGG